MHKPVQPATHWMQLNIKIDHLHLSRPFHQRLLQIHHISHPQCHQDLFHKTLDCPRVTCPLMMKQWICRVKIQSEVNEVLLKFLEKKKNVPNEQCLYSQTSLSDEYLHLFQNVRLLYDRPRLLMTTAMERSLFGLGSCTHDLCVFMLLLGEYLSKNCKCYSVSLFVSSGCGAIRSGATVLTSSMGGVKSCLDRRITA